MSIERKPTKNVKPVTEQKPLQPTEKPVQPTQQPVQPTQQPVQPSVQPTLTKAPVEEKRPDVVQPQVQLQDQEEETDESKEGQWWEDEGYSSMQDAINDGWYYDANTRQWTSGGQSSGGNNDGITDEQEVILSELSDKEKETKFQSDRKTRILETSQQAQQMAQGVMPEDIPTIPDPDKIPLDDTIITPEQTAELQMEATKQAEAATLGAVSPEQVSTIKDVSTALAPEPLQQLNYKIKIFLKFLKML